MKPVTAREMRDINRTCILEYMRQRGKVSRSAIAEDLELSLSSVVRITNELMDDKLIRLQGEHEFSGGRRRPLIELDTTHNVVVSLSLGATTATACLCDITGNILDSVSQKHNLKGASCIELLHQLADEMLSRAAYKIVRGISVGVPGVVLDGNRVMAAPAVGLDNFCLADRMAPHYECPVLVENDVNLAALGELWFGYGKACSNLIYIHVGTLLGMGIVLDRCILRGAHHGAGELGYLIFNDDELKKAYPQYGALEESLSGYGLQRIASSRAEGSRPVTPKELFELAQSGTPWAQDMVEAFQRKLSMVLVSVSALFDPEIIVLGGGVMESACKYLPAIRANIALKTPNPIRLEHSKLGRNARILGGCASIMHHVMHYSVIKGML
ncbi:MAG: ROK family protein [Clostridiales bacterium]|nr:ROK family protein [Clostridiales bacterium]